MVRKRCAHTRFRDRRRVRPKTPAPKTGWLKPELARLTQVSPRRIGDYLQRGLLPAPEFRGTATRYQRIHLIRLLAIERLLSMRIRRLDEVRRRMNEVSSADLEAWVLGGPLRPEVRQALLAGQAPGSPTRTGGAVANHGAGPNGAGPNHGAGLNGAGAANGARGIGRGRHLPQSFTAERELRYAHAMDEKVHERFCGVETKVAYHDRDIAEMNTTLYRQQQVIDQLQADLKKIRQQLLQLGLEADPTKDQPPPHY